MTRRDPRPVPGAAGRGDAVAVPRARPHDQSGECRPPRRRSTARRIRPRQATDETTDKDVPPLVRAGNRALEAAEGVVYVGISAFLVILALGAFVIAARQVPDAVRGGRRRPGRAGDPGHPAVGVHRRRVAVRRPDHHRQAGADRGAVPAGRHHRLDQGDRGAVGQGRRRHRQGQQLLRRHVGGRGARRAGAAPGDHRLAAAAQGTGAGRGRRRRAVHLRRRTPAGAAAGCLPAGDAPPHPHMGRCVR